MSEPLRIAVVVEGPTDSIVLEAIVRSLLAGAEFEFDTLQPAEDSAVFGANFRLHGPGWGGVYRWSRQATEKSDGSLSSFSKLSPSKWDLLIIHVDADVADKTYASTGIQSPPQNDLPCAKPCPPQTILCTPSKTMDAWVLTAIFPDNAIFQQQNWECHPDPAGQLKALPQGQRFSKKIRDYRERNQGISQAWPRVSGTLTEAARFQEEFLHAIHVDRH
ncbi:MAG: hypothetical protein OXF67_00170 [Cyanobacteria bacterium MAG CAR4_bin_6]|nr:hypothetical protein [Cyanobacteria bacterium MAG CAR4_bin_6]